MRVADPKFLWHQSGVHIHSRDISPNPAREMSSAGPGAGDDFARRARIVAQRSWKVLRANWHLGVTAFGGPPVHFKIVRHLFPSPSIPSQNSKLQWA